MIRNSRGCRVAARFALLPCRSLQIATIACRHCVESKGCFVPWSREAIGSRRSSLPRWLGSSCPRLEGGLASEHWSLCATPWGIGGRRSPCHHCSVLAKRANGHYEWRRRREGCSRRGQRSGVISSCGVSSIFGAFRQVVKLPGNGWRQPGVKISCVGLLPEG